MSGAAVQRRPWRFFAPDRLAEYPGIWAASLCCTLAPPCRGSSGWRALCGWQSHAVDLSNSAMARMPGLTGAAEQESMRIMETWLAACKDTRMLGTSKLKRGRSAAAHQIY